MKIKVKQSQAKPTHFKAFRLYASPKIWALAPVKVSK